MALAVLSARAQDNETCLVCHEDEDLTGINSAGVQVPMYVPVAALSESVHDGFDCITCHTDLEGVEDWPHAEQLAAVDCGACHEVTGMLDVSVHGLDGNGRRRVECRNCHGHHRILSPTTSDPASESVRCGQCHDSIARVYAGSLHGRAFRAGARLAPQCWDCHGAHDIASKVSPDSRTRKFHIPFMCGHCHKEGSPVTQMYDIPVDSILTHYSQSIHGVGLYRQGLTVTAVCSDCHTAHNVRDHTDPQSSIHRNNVSKTCRLCHSLIEQVHRKVVRGELWEKEPGKVPVCVDCHTPHEIRRVFYEEDVADRECLRCHGRRDLSTVRGEETVSLFVDSLETGQSMHRGVTCAQCHTGVTPRHGERPCATVINRVDCSICHAEIVETYAESIHGKLADRGDPEAPVCADCHGTHGVKGRIDSSSPTFARNVPRLCGRCHRLGAVAARRIDDGHERVQEYVMSIHGKGLLESGLVVTAMCTDCHTAHHELPADNPASSVHRNNLAVTCAACHDGIYETFQSSIHSPNVSHSENRLPVCNDCHFSHTIVRADQVGFRLTIRLQCGSCHRDVTESYFETTHGKASRLGHAAAAQCYDCHGAHDILPPENAASHLSRQNIVETCGQCHTGSHRQFAGYLTHATHHDRTKYPILFYTFWFMTTLLVGTLVVAGTHTVLWLPRSWQMMRDHQKKRRASSSNLQYRRFKPLHSRLHFLVVISFLGLAVTGLTLKFSYLSWAQWLSDVLGGFESTGYFHRLCALITFGYFFTHIVEVVHSKRKSRRTWRRVLFGENSMMFNRTDWRELKGTIRWFFGRGRRPEYGRWTYWEKFDYFAVFWGVAVIGTTGLMLWFPATFTRVLPGWIINVAQIVHSDEALLATAFIFTVHFFNTHFRPDKFPMDTTIFTGRVPLEELRHDRPREYRVLIRSREIRRRLVQPLSPMVLRTIRIFGAAALTIGISLIFLIIYAEIFGYR